MIEQLLATSKIPGALPEAIDACERQLGIAIPEDLRAFLLRSDGFSDEVGQGYLALWSLTELLAGEGYEFFPVSRDRFLIGSNAGPTAYACWDGKYVSVPFNGDLKDEMRALGASLEEFVDAIANGEGY